MERGKDSRVKALLEEALQFEAARRQAFLDEACAGDAALRREVASLAEAYDEAGTFLEAPIPMAALTSAVKGASGDAGAVYEQARLPIGTVINGRYQVEDFQGEGGMGAVYRVTDIARSRTLAFKILRRRTALLELFKIEFRTLVQLGHPNLAKSHDFEAIGGTDDYGFTMDFIDGRNVFDATDGAAWPAVVDLLVPLCRALSYVHSRGIVHRDIKPNNVLVAADGTLKLVDFGLVGWDRASDRLMGTPSFIAPESLEGRGDHRADLYSLGVLLYQLLYRSLPSRPTGAADVAARDARSSIACPEAPDLPAWLKDIVVKLREQDPADRYRNANQVIDAVNLHITPAYPVETAVTRDSYVLSGRFVGRHEELAELSRFVDGRLRSPGDRPAFAWISGQSGAGKSRLVRELRHALQLDDKTFVEGTCFDGGAADFEAFAEVLAQLTPLAASRGGGALIAQSLSELVKVAPGLGAGRAIDPSPPLATPEAERRRLIDTIAAFLVETSRLVPYVLHVNDLQWSSEGTIDILRNLHHRIDLAQRRHDRIPIAVLGSFRDDETAGRPIARLIEDTRGDAARVRLMPLAATPMQQLLESMFGLEDIPPSFVARVLTEAGGSPFFLEELVRALVENGSVFVEDGVWRTVSAVGDLEIPATIAAALRHRFSLLPGPSERVVLCVLAAYRKPMAASLLATAAGLTPADTSAALSDLRARRMVTSAGNLHRTAHDHVRTTVYADLGADARDVHRQIGRALEHTRHEGPRFSETARHYWLAQDRDKALEFGLKAGQAAMAVYANEEAIEHLGHVLDLLPDADSATRAAAAEQLADAHFLAGHYPQAHALLADLDRRVVAPIDRTRIRRKLGEVVAYDAGTPMAAVDILWGAAEQLGATRPGAGAAFLIATLRALARHLLQSDAAPLVPVVHRPTERARLGELVRVYLRISYLSFFGDPLLTFLPTFRAANIADRIGESDEHSNAYSMAAIALSGLGFHKRALRYGQAATNEARRLGSPWHIANAHSFHATVLMQTGHWQSALEHAERGREGFVACGDHFQLAIALYTILELLHARGCLSDAVARGREELAVYERLGVQMIGKGPYAVYGQALAKTGAPEGLVIGREVLERAQQGFDRLSTTIAHVALGDSLLHLDRLDEAIDHLEQGMAIRKAGRFEVYMVARGSALLAQAYAEKLTAPGATKSGSMRSAFERRAAEAISASRRWPPLRSSARFVRGLSCRMRGEPEQAHGCFADAARLAERQGAAAWEADAHVERGLALLERGASGRVDARAALEQAGALYRACGARPREQRTLAVLAQLG